MKKKFTYVLSALTPIIIYLIMGVIWGGDHRWMFSTTLPAIFLFSFLIFKITKSKFHFTHGILITLPIFLIFLVTSFFAGFSRSILYLIFIPISIWLGWLYFYRNTIIVPIIAFIGFSIIGIVFFPNVKILFNNYGAHSDKDFNNLTLVNKMQEKVIFDSTKIVVLDFWTTSCGVCFKKFPEFEKYYLEYKDNPKVEFYSINVPLKSDDFNNVVKLVEELDYEFPTIYATKKEEVERLGIHAYPHLLILKNGRIRYDGYLVTNKYIFVNHISSEINKLLKE